MMSQLFAPSLPPQEIILRGTVVYLSLFALLRMMFRREAGTLNLPDLLMIVLVADASQNAMAGQYRSITDGLLLVGTIAFWNFLLDWLGFRFPFLRRLILPPPLLLIQNGVLQRRNMRRELVTLDELMMQLREAGIEDPSRVRKAYMEGDGRFSIFPYGKTSKPGSKEA